MDLENYLYKKVLPIIQNWSDENIYAISFFVYSNEEYQYNGISNVSEFSIGYSTEKDCSYAPELSEERWNLICCRQGETDIIKADDNDEGAKILFNWYKENGIENIGFEDWDNAYDADMNYIGKGPNGYYELLKVVSDVARRLQTEGKISVQFGSIPIIVHDYEYPWYIEEATVNANPNGEAAIFLKALKEGFPE